MSRCDLDLGLDLLTLNFCNTSAVMR